MTEHDICMDAPGFPGGRNETGVEGRTDAGKTKRENRRNMTKHDIS